MAPVTSRKLRPRKKAVATGADFTTTRGNKGGGISTTTTRNKRRREQGKTTTTRKKRVAQASNVQPGSDDDNSVDSGSDDGNDVDLVSREILVVDAKLIAVEVKRLSLKSLQYLETFLRRKGMSRDGGPYKDAIQKLKKGKKIDEEVGERIAKYIYERIAKYIYLWLSGFRIFLLTLIRVEDWDDEIVGEIIKFIKTELNVYLGVEVQEVQKLLKIAEDVRSESDETLKLKNCAHNWVMNTTDLGKTLSDWEKKPTPSFRSFDEDYIDDDQAFPSGQGLFP